MQQKFIVPPHIQRLWPSSLIVWISTFLIWISSILFWISYFLVRISFYHVYTHTMTIFLFHSASTSTSFLQLFWFLGSLWYIRCTNANNFLFLWSIFRFLLWISSLIVWISSILLLELFYYPFGFLLLSFWIYSIILLDFLFSHLDFLFIVSISSFSNFDFFFSHLDFSFPRLDFLFHSVSGTASSSVLLIVAISLARSCTGSICTQRITLYLHLEKLKSKVNDFKQFCKRFYCFTKLKITARRTIVLI